MELDSMGEKKFRAEQIFNWLHIKKVTEFSEMSNISLELRTKLSEKFYIKRLNIVKRLESCVDNTIKYLYELEDGNHIESVLMDYKHGNSICISTQVGCKMGCNFCASTIAGFRRNLTPSEMLMQIYLAEKDSGRHVDSLVLMGIGEPLDNYNNVIRFLELLSCPKGRNMSLRHVSLSTCGIVPRINDLAKLKTGLTLSVSLHSADNKRRSEIMPVNRSWDINELIAACREYIKETGRRISFEYAVISGVNDSPADAEALAGLLRGMNCHINLIPVNKIKERSYSADRKSVEQFSKRLERLGMNVTVRRTLGADINAACGQLRREYEI
ncbi:MAG: 23S rRNA (adenine(2503)-C(2))-methyltransferase RlmN [Oscillospiraceae bacterium]|nr:23S rRNA (adenine(2503)-C(2))-methyltransferase RlmN [Oscillospiraceae bacterium]MDY6208388.1 23S rRNA (adenine(2503)-C(2))-methyltransferase RlmN [Oscillospiraceae bacterium]